MPFVCFQRKKKYLFLRTLKKRATSLVIMMIIVHMIYKKYDETHLRQPPRLFLLLLLAALLSSMNATEEGRDDDDAFNLLRGGEKARLRRQENVRRQQRRRKQVSEKMLSEASRSSLSSWRPLIMLSTPEQSSTLVSDAMRKVLNITDKSSLRRGCPPEFFNPGCQRDRINRGIPYSACFSSLNFGDFWGVCTERQFDDVLLVASQLGWKFTVRSLIPILSNHRQTNITIFSS